MLVISPSVGDSVHPEECFKWQPSTSVPFGFTYSEKVETQELLLLVIGRGVAGV